MANQVTLKIVQANPLQPELYRTLAMVVTPLFFHFLWVPESWVLVGIRPNFKALVQETEDGECTPIIENFVEPLSREI